MPPPPLARVQQSSWKVACGFRGVGSVSDGVVGGGEGKAGRFVDPQALPRASLDPGSDSPVLRLLAAQYLHWRLIMTPLLRIR